MPFKSFARAYEGMLFMPQVGGMLGTTFVHGTFPVPNQGRTLDAAGESVTVIGPLLLSTGPGTSATLSAAGGGAIHWVTYATNTFANAGTTLRIGLQDVDATGIEDGTFDVYADLVGGTDTITDRTAHATVMESGTKTITHGDRVALSFELTARGGSDAVQLGYSFGTMHPYGSQDTGAGPARTSGVSHVLIVFDTGVVGWFGGPTAPVCDDGKVTFAANSTPDEYALIFRLPWPARVDGLSVMLGSVTQTDDFELILYHSPLGTPTVMEAISADVTYAGPSTSNAQLLCYQLSRLHTLSAGVSYAVAYRPTTNNTATLHRASFSTGGSRAVVGPLGIDWYEGTRTDQTGAFAADLTKLPLIGFTVAAIDANARPPRTRLYKP